VDRVAVAKGRFSLQSCVAAGELGGDRVTFKRLFMKRILTWIGALLALAIVGNTMMAWRVNSQQSARLAAIRAAGLPASIAELRPAPVPDSLNAAAVIEAATPAINAFGGSHVNFLDRTPLGKAYGAINDHQLPTVEQAAAMRAILDQHAALDAAITQAAARNVWASRADFTLDHTQFLATGINGIQTIRGAGRYAAWQIAVLAREGKTDDAVRRGVDLLKLARLHESNPTLVSYLVTIAVRGVAAHALNQALRSGPVSAEVRAALDAELARDDDPQSFIKALVTERAVALEAMGPMNSQVPPLVVAWLGWPVKQQYMGAYDLLDVVIVEAKQPWQQFRRAIVSGNLNSAPRGTLGDLLWPGLRAGVEARTRDLAQIRALRILNALQGFGEAQGREASGLADLGLPADATVDPYSGQPLLLKHGGGGWIVYSVGQNSRDDGGALNDQRLDVGIGPMVDAVAVDDDSTAVDKELADVEPDAGEASEKEAADDE
jgi:hypothetical protein